MLRSSNSPGFVAPMLAITCAHLITHPGGLGAACDSAQQEMERDQQHIKRLSERLYNGITSQLEVGSCSLLP